MAFNGPILTEITVEIDKLSVNVDGSINVVPILGDGKNYKNLYNSISSVSAASLSTIMTYVVPIATNSKIYSVDVSGTNIASFQIEVNSSIIDKKLTYFGSGLNERFLFDGRLNLISGDILEIKVIHSRSFLGDFNSRLTVLEQI